MMTASYYRLSGTARSRLGSRLGRGGEEGPAMTLTRHQRKQTVGALYERYGKPLETRHRSEYVAIINEGAMVIAPALRERMQRAAEALGRGVFDHGQRSLS